MKRKYKIVYLPLAFKDMEDIFEYISPELNAQDSAIALLDKMESSILRLSEFPYSCPEYRVSVWLGSGLRALKVNNYLVFYTVIEDAVEIWRVIYAKRDIEALLAHLNSFNQ